MQQLNTSTPDTARLKSAQRVRIYLEDCYSRLGPGQSVRLATTRELAKNLGVSPRTVHKIYNEYVISGHIQARVGDGSVMARPKSEANGKSCTLGIMTCSSGGVSVGWCSEVYSGILHACSESDLSVSIQTVSTPLPELESNLLAAINKVDGFIFFPFLGVANMMHKYSLAGKSTVCLNPPLENATANFVSPSYYLSSRRIGAAWKMSNRRRVLFVSGNATESVSTRLRLAGLCTGLGENLAGTTEIKFLEVPGAEQSLTYGYLKKWMTDNKTWTPDAIYCAGDYQALGAYTLLKEIGKNVPDDVSIIGGTGYDLSQTVCPSLTRMQQSLHELGMELFRMFERRHITGGADVPGKYLEGPFIGLATTTPQENRCLNVNTAE